MTQRLRIAIVGCGTGGRGQMLRVLTGTRRGWLGTFGLPPGFIEALAGRSQRCPAAPATGIA